MDITKEMIVKRMMDHGKGIKISDLCCILKCDTHNIRDILHDDPCFVQDAKSFLWSYFPSKDKDKTIIKLMTKDEPMDDDSIITETNGNKVTIKTINKKETKTMKNETIEKITLTDIIDNLNSGNKNETLKKAKSDLSTFIQKNKAMVEFTQNPEFKILKKALNKSVRTKADFIEIIVSYFDAISQENEDVKEPDVLLDADKEFQDAINAVESIVHEPEIDEDFKIPESQKEYDNLLYANSIVIPGLGKINTLDMTVQSLIKTIIRMDGTIKCMENQIKNLSVLQPLCPVKVVMENGGKSPIQEKVEYIKSAAEILEEKRLEYVKGLKGVKADILTYFANKSDTIITQDNIIMDIVLCEEYGDYLKNDIINGLKGLIDRGLLIKVTQDKKPCFKNAQKGDFIPEKTTKKENKDNDTKKEQNLVKTENSKEKIGIVRGKKTNETKTPENKPKMKRGKKGYTRRDAVVAFINDNKNNGFTMAELNKGQEKYYLDNVPGGKAGAVCSNICGKVVKEMIANNELVKNGRIIESA